MNITIWIRQDFGKSALKLSRPEMGLNFSCRDRTCRRCIRDLPYSNMAKAFVVYILTLINNEVNLGNKKIASTLHPIDGKQQSACKPNLTLNKNKSIECEV